MLVHLITHPTQQTQIIEISFYSKVVCIIRWTDSNNGVYTLNKEHTDFSEMFPKELLGSTSDQCPIYMPATGN